MRGVLPVVALMAVLAGAVRAQSVAPLPDGAGAGAGAGMGAGGSIPPREQTFFYHYEWTRGAVVTAQEWRRGAAIDAKQDDLPRAAAGEEWREIDRNYVLVSQATHAVMQVVAAPHPTVPGRSGGEP